jgi:DNA-binding Lrp family transcriptional regulator
MIRHAVDPVFFNICGLCCTSFIIAESGNGETAVSPYNCSRWVSFILLLWRTIMVSAVVLLNVEPGQVNEVGARLAELAGISEVFSVGGRFDLVAVIRVKNNEELAELVTQNMHSVPGITNSETLIAFKVFSEHDLAAMFSIGM